MRQFARRIAGRLVWSWSGWRARRDAADRGAAEPEVARRPQLLLGLPRPAEAGGAPAESAAPAPAQLVDQARRDGAAPALEIAQLCELLGRADLANGYIQAGWDPGRVRGHLLEARAAASDATQIFSTTTPGPPEPGDAWQAAVQRAAAEAGEAPSRSDDQADGDGGER